MEVAALAVQVQPMFFSTKEYCRDYLTDREPEFFVKVTAEDLLLEQKLLDQEAEAEGMKKRKFTDPFLERTAIQRKIADHLISRNTLMLHGSTVAVDGKVYLFTAPCGTGKSTHTRLWREVFGDRAVMVNDDKPFLQLTPTGVLTYGSPWSGKHGLASNICVPLQGVCFLHRGESNRIQPIPAMQLREALRQQLHEPTDKRLQESGYGLLDTMLKMIPTWEMYCNKNPDAATVSHEAMRKA